MTNLVSLRFLATTIAVGLAGVASLCAAPSGASQRNEYSIQGILGMARPLVSPEVKEGGMITFRRKAPQAHEVALHFGEWDVVPQAMQRDDGGVWSVTIGPVKPGIYHYTFSIDGAPALDLANPRAKIGLALDASVVEVPGTPARFDEVQAVPHGVLHIHSYRSTPLQRERQVYVFTPPGYEQDPARHYPVLYLRHGGGDTEASWSRDGRAHIILENLLAGKKAVPMLIVMTNGMTDGSWAGGSSVDGMKAMERELLEDVIPLVEKSYRVEAKPSARALAGLSMGGGQAFIIGLRHPETFSWIGQFSSGLLADRNLDLTAWIPEALQNVDATNRSVALLWIGCGERDPRLQGHIDLVEELRKRGLHCEWHPGAGGHEWRLWRQQLAGFLEKAFQPKN
jgi:enterochelin esterase family protein